MKTLLLRLEGPMQSWGRSSRFTERDTGLEPSKSGVLGLLCAALGKPRDENPESHKLYPTLEMLSEMRMGVRVDAPGKVGVDFQSAGGGELGSRTYGVAKADGSKAETVLSWRYFLQDAVFLVGFESSDIALLERLQQALKEPVWPLYLGRKSYVPGLPPFLPDGLVEGKLKDALLSYPLLRGEVPSGGKFRFILDDYTGREQRVDVPLDFARRIFGQRLVSVTIESLCHSTTN